MKNLKKNKGMVFVTAIFLMSILLSMGTAYLHIARKGTEAGITEFDYLLASYHAEAGVQHMIAKLKKDGLTADNFAEYKPGGSGPADYSVSYTAATKTIDSDGSSADNSYSLKVKTVIDEKRYTGAIQGGGTVSKFGSNTGTITGDVDAVNAIDDLAPLTVTGDITPLSLINIPAADLVQYGIQANFTPAGVNVYTSTDCTYLDSTPDPLPGIYYITGYCYISQTNFNLNGSIIVNGNNLMLNQMMTSMTITPLTDVSSISYPAIAVSGNIQINQAFNTNINGLIYAGGDITISACDSGFGITGAIVAGNNLLFSNVKLLNLTFDAAMDPPYFSGGGGKIDITLWRDRP